MVSSFEERAGAICARCGGRCCKDANPPVSPDRIAALQGLGIGKDDIEYAGYTRLRSQEGGMCVMFSGGRCRIHSAKPETCVAGPFTFEVTDHTLSLFLKRESSCPLVKHLNEDPEAYQAQYREAVRRLVRLIRSLPPGELEVISRIPEHETDLVAGIPLPP
ncbi:MAG: YkgJ family cysteine cluster protein [Methanolinea sp.]|nr:YkgJ family cysteine cluster protein [Methanolinea sp.]